MTSYGKLILRDDKTTEEFSLSENTIIGYGAHCDIRLLTAAQNKPFNQALIVSNGQKVHVTNLSDGSSGPTLVNGRMLKHNESIQLNSGDVLAFSFRQFLFEYVAPLSVPGQKPSARRETIAPSSQMMPIVVQRTISKITNRRASVPEDKLTPPSATLPVSTFEDSPVEDSSNSHLPKLAEVESTGELAVIATDSSTALNAIVDEVVKFSSDTNKYEAESGDFPMEEACEPQETLQTQKDPAPVIKPGTGDTEGEICDVSTISNELPATEGQPESSGLINSSVGHDDTFVLTSQTDIEMTSEPQNDSLVSEDLVLAAEPVANNTSEEIKNLNEVNTGETCALVSEIVNVLPATGKQPKSFDSFNGTAKHDCTLDMVITSQTDNEMISESQNASLVCKGSSTLPEDTENEATIIEMESTAAIESILGLSAKTSVNTNPNNQFEFCDTPTEEVFEPQEVLQTQKDPAPVIKPGTGDTEGEICDVSTISNELPATEGQPESSGLINSSVGHDDTFVLTSQTDIEMTSEPQNDSLVSENEMVLLISHTKELKKPHDFLNDLPKSPTKDDGPEILVIDQLQQISDEDELKGHPRSKFDSPPPLKISFEAGIQSAGRPSRAAKSKSAHQPAQTRGKGKESRKSQCIEQVQETKGKATQKSPEPKIEEQVLETKRKGRKPTSQSQISEQVQETKRRGRKNINEPEFVEQVPETKRRGRRKVPEPQIVEQMTETTLKGKIDKQQTTDQIKGNRSGKPQIPEEGKQTKGINEPKSAIETKSTRKHSKPDKNEAEKRVTRSMSKKSKTE